MKFVTDLRKGILGSPDKPDLWQDIIGNISDSLLKTPNIRILVVACGHATEAVILARRMLALGVNKKSVNESIWLIDKYQVFTNPAKQIYGFTNVVTDDFLTWNPTMKFNVILGNPPYQDPNNDKRMLWNQFADKCIDIAAEDAHIALVHPTTWLTTKTNIHNSYRLFEQLQVEKAVIYDREDKPFEEGTSVSYTITKNTKRHKPTKLYYAKYNARTEDFVADINIAQDKFWPGQLTPINLKIHNKLQTHKKIKFIKSCEFHNQKLKAKKLVSDTKSAKFPYTHHVSAAITRYTNVKFSDHDTWKVMVPLTSTIDRAVIDKECGHGEDMLSLYVTNQSTAKNIKKLFNTKLYKFIGKLYKNGRNQPLQNLFPLVDFNVGWTDDELYKHFKLTKQEIAYIESNVK